MTMIIFTGCIERCLGFSGDLFLIPNFAVIILPDLAGSFALDGGGLSVLSN